MKKFIALEKSTRVWEDKHLGYMVVYAPYHPMSYKSGKLYYHRYVVAESLQRNLLPTEVVHHKDGNRKNNSLNNLEITDISVHARGHIEERGVTLNGYELMSDNEKHSVCQMCGNKFKRNSRKRKKYCSKRCAAESSRKISIKPEVLKELIWLTSTSNLASIMGISDSAIGKYCKKHGIIKPPVGYWAKNKELSQDESGRLKLLLSQIQGTM